MAETEQEGAGKKQKGKKEKKEKPETDKQKKFPQYFAGISACLGGFYIGAVIGWSSPASTMLKSVSASFAWIASIMTVGAAFSQILTAILMELIGRKLTILILTLFTCLTWTGFAVLESNKDFLITLRFFHGFFAGGFCMVCPTFIGEIAHKSTRGCLGVCFQGFLTIGILYSYAFCLSSSFLVFSVFGAAPTVLVLTLLCVKESPVYLMKKGKEEKAEKALVFYRGKEYDGGGEMAEIKKMTAKDETSFCSALKEKSCTKALGVLLGMHCIQQLSGINAIMFYAGKIFKMSGDEGMECFLLVVLGVVQVAATLIAAFVVDRTGRRILWFISLLTMSFALIGCGLYLQLKQDNFALPLGILIYVYIVGFSLGAGPLPWAMLGELIPTRVKGPVATAVTVVNWLLAFGVTATFDGIVGAVGSPAAFYGYGAIALSGLVFVLFCVVETNGKSLEEIQEEMRSGKVRPTATGR